MSEIFQCKNGLFLLRESKSREIKIFRFRDLINQK